MIFFLLYWTSDLIAWKPFLSAQHHYPRNKCIIKVKNRNTRKRGKTCSKLTTKMPEWFHTLHTFFYCFSCWLWTVKRLVGIELLTKKMKIVKLTFHESSLCVAVLGAEVRSQKSYLMNPLEQNISSRILNIIKAQK